MKADLVARLVPVVVNEQIALLGSMKLRSQRRLCGQTKQRSLG